MNPKHVRLIRYEADIQTVGTHCALVIANLNEFNHSGHDGMAELCDDNHDQFLWYNDKCQCIMHTETKYGTPEIVRIIHPTVLTVIQ